MKESINNIRQMLAIDIDEATLINILFDINRYFDSTLTKTIHAQQKQANTIFNAADRKLLRTYFYYGRPQLPDFLRTINFPTIEYTDDDIERVATNTLTRLSKYEPTKILDSIKERYNNLTAHNTSVLSHRDEWLHYYERKRQEKFNSSAFILRLTDDDFRHHGYDASYIYEIIRRSYAGLENYRHLIIFADGRLHNASGDDVTWKVLYKLTVFAENFIQYTGKFSPCKKAEQKEVLASFINERFCTQDGDALASEFYKNISTGFKYEDCFVADDQSKIFITLKKIARDESAVPCPSCMTTIQSGNSYPEMFLRSYECKNSSCQERSKSGRGKRFDEYGVYRAFKLEENDRHDRIDGTMYSAWRRDVFSGTLDCIEMFLRYYTWHGETVLAYNIPPVEKDYSRHIVDYIGGEPVGLTCYDELPIVRLFHALADKKHLDCGKTVLTDDITVINGDSTQQISALATEQIGAAITSPPYYNAREYSQWKNMLLYFIDMMINAKAVFDKLVDGGSYLYNIGDIVCEDNVFVRSKMSERRLPLGFLSCMIFEEVGFSLNENIIWDKGEVQSKRSSTVNLISGYVKCVNCYEHVLVFGKNATGKNPTKVIRLTPVIKINSKGENTYKHTAPYPLELVSLIKPYLIKDKYILDPYLGSGTTLKWCRLNGCKGVGVEINEQYFALAKKYIFEKP